MIIGGTTDLDSTVKGLVHLRTYAPYRYGGTWYVAFIDGKGYAARSMATLTKYAQKANLTRLDVATITKEST